MQLRDEIGGRASSVISRREKVWLIIGAPLLLAFLTVEVRRVWRALNGEPLLITGLFGSDITVDWSVNPFTFLLGAAFHLIILTVLLGVLWAQFDLIKRWLGTRNGQA